MTRKEGYPWSAFIKKPETPAEETFYELFIIADGIHGNPCSQIYLYVYLVYLIYLLKQTCKTSYGS